MRIVHTRSFRTVLLGTALIASTAACGDDPTSPNPLNGTYTATTLRVTPDGQPEIDILAEGGTLSLTLSGQNTVAGSLFIPASATGGEAFTANMAGTVVRTGNTVRFDQDADNFVRDLTWTVSNGSLTVVNQAAGNARFTATLMKQ